MDWRDRARKNPHGFIYKKSANDLRKTFRMDSELQVQKIGKYWYIVQLSNGFLYCNDGVFRDCSACPMA